MTVGFGYTQSPDQAEETYRFQILRAGPVTEAWEPDGLGETREKRLWRNGSEETGVVLPEEVGRFGIWHLSAEANESMQLNLFGANNSSTFARSGFSWWRPRPCWACPWGCC